MKRESGISANKAANSRNKTVCSLRHSGHVIKHKNDLVRRFHLTGIHPKKTALFRRTVTRSYEFYAKTLFWNNIPICCSETDMNKINDSSFNVK